MLVLKYYRGFVHPIRTIATNAPPTKFLDIPNGKKIAYEKVEGSAALPTVMFVPGFMNRMDEDMPRHLKDFCMKKNYTFVTYDPTGVGDSPGDLSSVEFQDWVENAGSVLEYLGSEQNIVIGISMGGWISLWMASQEMYKEKIKSMMVIAPAVNFFRPFYADTFKKLSQEGKNKLERGEIYHIQDEYGIKPLKKSFAENSANFELDLSEPLDITCPVKILHGLSDETIPYNNSMGVMEKIMSEEVELIYRKGAEHRFQGSQVGQYLQT